MLHARRDGALAIPNKDLWTLFKASGVLKALFLLSCLDTCAADADLKISLRRTISLRNLRARRDQHSPCASRPRQPPVAATYNRTSNADHAG